MRMSNVMVGAFPAVSGLSQALNDHLKPQVMQFLGHHILSITSHDISQDSTPLRVAKNSFEQANLGTRLWETISGIDEGDVASIQSCARRYGKHLDFQIKRTNELIKGAVGGIWKSDIIALQPLLMSDLERLKFSLGLIGEGRIEGDTRSHIAEGAALLYLNSILTQVAFVAMSVRHTCTGPLYDLLKNGSVYDLSSYREDVCHASDLLDQIRDITRHRIRPALFEEAFLSRESLAVVNSAMHLVNNRFTAANGYYGFLAETMRQYVKWMTVDARSRLLKVLGDCNEFPDMLVHTAVSDDEPVVFVGRQFPGVKLFRKGAIPVDLDSKKINIIVSHFVHNAVTHPHPGRELQVRVLQTPHGIFVLDNGMGISSERLREVESQVRSGFAVKSDHEVGTGQGLRDSVLLLKDLFGGFSTAENLVITIESREGHGTVSSITWGDDPNHVHPKIMPEGWNRIQFTSNSDSSWQDAGFSGTRTRRTTNATRRKAVITRPVLDMTTVHIETYGRG